MTDNDINEEMLKNIGGKSESNLNEILRNFTDAEFEVQTFDDSSSINIDSMTDNLKPYEKSFSRVSIFRILMENLTNLHSLILFKWIKF